MRISPAAAVAATAAIALSHGTPLRGHDGPHPAAGFVDSVVIAGLEWPTAVVFAADGRIFIAEKPGVVTVFDSLVDPSPAVAADLRTRVHDYWDRGLLGLALHPSFPLVPWLYVLYTHDAAIGGTAPTFGVAGAPGDGCPTPPASSTAASSAAGCRGSSSIPMAPGREPSAC